MATPLNPTLQRYAVVTGGGAGIGEAFARRLAEDGFVVAIVDCDEGAAESVAQSLSGAISHKLDVSDDLAWAQLEGTLRSRWPRVDLLVNCAGMLHGGPLLTTSADSARRILDVNLLGAVFGCQTLGPWMAEAPPLAWPRGVINVASIFAPLAPPGFAIYSASKAGLLSLSDSLRGELRPLGLRATAVLPGVVRTGLFARATYASEPFQQAASQYLSESVLAPEAVAHAGLHGFARNRPHVVVGRRARWYWTLKRAAPGRTIDRVAAVALRRIGAEAFRPPAPPST
ncbi:Diacetyl reductase [(S)-acetoin forming] [Pirellulimonas nuda]|uniref:Diacetyl reductase [(S)-acetoin forming] n=1 Tax=Pirellulimonas nuda TaxID=2528009 RepID=A0A518D7D0_9BACT|nr:SDR family NAD(P)-dependent oxidoreductase [Pirellulimonas nuda]QDU87387.1 Diacetyl reductase [(S)-acetoin forming] [Pirellulimonas nuda]